MDTKAFITGVVAGAAAMALAVWVLDDSRRSDSSHSPVGSSEASTPGSAIVAEERRQARADRQVPGHQTTADPDKDREAEPQKDEAASGLRSTSRNRVAGPAVNRANATQSARVASDEGPAEDREPAEPSEWPRPRADRLDESRDPDWSHYMEQTLSRYLAGHPSASRFDVTNVDCRTTFCELQAVGFDESTGPVWTQIVYDIRTQPWAQFDMNATEARKQDGRLHVTAILHRTRPR